MNASSYHILQRIAVGGMAEILLARHKGSDGFERHVALKRILPEYASDAGFVEAFLQEARLAAQLVHPHIVQIHDLGAIDETLFIAMEYIPGLDLAALLRWTRREGVYLPLSVVLRIFADICAGLHYAHNAHDVNDEPLGIVHRDVTPSNILVSDAGPSKLLDFGIAKATGRADPKTKTGTLKGKFAYLAPEQIYGTPIDRRVDIFSAGIILYEMLTNVNPFRGATEYESLQNIVHRMPPLISTVRPELPEELDDVVARALRQDRELRYPTADAFDMAIQDVVREYEIVVTHAEVADYLRKHRPAVLEAEKTQFASSLQGQIVQLGRIHGPRTLPRSWLFGSIAALAFSAFGVFWALRPPPSTTAPNELPVARVITDPPGATVFVDDVLYTGETPLIIGELSTDRPHHVAVTKEGYAPAHSSFTLENRGITTLQLALVKLRTSDNAQQIKRTKPALPPLVAPTNTAKDERPGILRLIIKPWGIVTIDGVSIGETPIMPQTLAPGRHSVVVENTDSHQTHKHVVTVPPNETIDLRDQF